jgi:glycosyltransferase involved in cell wall biosynthesis
MGNLDDFVPPAMAVVCAAYNAQKEIRMLLESLCASRYKDFEVCLCDDASSDATANVIASFSGRLRLRIVRNESNRGVTYSRNRAMALARAPLLLFVDADIRLYPDTIEKLVGRLAASGADVAEGIYSDTALDPGLFSDYYAMLVHHSFLAAQPRAYNVFNGWCALSRRDVMDRLGGHAVVAKGVEIENESLGRRIVARGYRLILDPGIAVDHHRGGLRKLLFIFTSRVYWWVKIFFADGWHFESALTTRSFAFATLCLPAALLALAFGRTTLWGQVVAGILTAGFFAGYGPFLAFVCRRRGAPFAAWSAILGFSFSLVISLSAAYSCAEELLRCLAGRGYTLRCDDLEGLGISTAANKRSLPVQIPKPDITMNGAPL